VKTADRGGQPTPVATDGPSMHDLVISQLRDAYHEPAQERYEALIRVLRERRVLGLERYGTILQASNGRDFLRDALDEVVDLVVYLRGAIQEYEPPPAWLRVAYANSVNTALELAWQVEKR